MARADKHRQSRTSILWRTLPVVVLGVALSATVASMTAHRSDEDARRLFDNDATQAVEAVESEIDRHLEGVGDLEQFISLTWPTPSQTIIGYNRRVWGDERFPAFSPPGIVANISAEQTQEFEAWRRTNDDPEFKIWTMGPVPDGDKLVLVGSPSADDAEGGPEGLELSMVVGLLGIELPDLEQGVVFAHNESVTSMLEQLTGMIAEGGALEESNIVGTDALIYTAVPSADGEEIVAYIVVPTRLGLLLEQAVNSSSRSLDMTLTVAGRDDLGEVGRFVQSGEEKAADHHQLVETIQAGGLDWVVTVGANSDYARSSAAVGTNTILVGGTLVSLLVAALIALRRAKKLQLDAAKFEIDVARTLAHTDSLTGLLNREGLADRLHGLGARSAAVLFVDLDGFKAVNDQLGHDAGDRVLRETAARMRTALREDDLLARLGGDEFIAVLVGVTDVERVAEVAERVKESIRTDVEGLSVTSSVGVAVHNGTDNERFVLEDLLHQADLAMYAAKRSGGDSVLFETR